MRTLYLLILGLLVTSCASLNDVHPANTLQKEQPVKKEPSKSASSPVKKKNPLSVSFYSKSNLLKQAYKIVGIESVSKYNKVGIKRQEASIRDSMRKIAANMGGDAIIEENHNSKTVTGTVVSFDEAEQNNNA